MMTPARARQWAWFGAGVAAVAFVVVARLTEEPPPLSEPAYVQIPSTPSPHAPSPTSAAVPTQSPSKHSAISQEVPFTPQAPYAVWDELHKEACEEASALIVGAYFSGVGSGLIAPEAAEEVIIKMVAWQRERFGAHKDLTLAEEAELIEQFYPRLTTAITEEVTLENLTRELHSGKLIILPASGRDLGNPFFRQPGPIYHMLVVIGVRGDSIITNDPGTKRGAGYAYRAATLLGAVHEWNGNPDDIRNGPVRMLVVGGR